MSVLIRGGRIVTAADDYVADLYIEDETITLIGESLDVQADKVIDAAGKYVLPGCIDPHTHLDMPFGGTVDDRRRRVRADLGRVRRHDLPRRLHHPAAGPDVRGRVRRLALEGERQADDRHGLPHGGHRSEGRRHARGARDAARAGHHVVQALHGVQGRADGRRRDALQHDGGGGEDRRARDGARRERRRRSTCS